MFQIVFNEISAAELSQLETLEQLELLEEFKVGKEDLDNLNGERFGKIDRDGRLLYRFRAKDYRFYFEVKDGSVIVHRVDGVSMGSVSPGRRRWVRTNDGVSKSMGSVPVDGVAPSR